MSLRAKISMTLWAVLLTGALEWSGSLAKPPASAQAWGEPVNGLVMSMDFDGPEAAKNKLPNFRIVLRNEGDVDLVLNLGIMVNDGKWDCPNAVVLILTNAKGESQKLELEEPGAPYLRMDPLVLPLPAGATFSFPADLDHYWRRAACCAYKPKLTEGPLSVKAQFEGKGFKYPDWHLDVYSFALMPYWEGTVTSNEVKFGAVGENAAPVTGFVPGGPQESKYPGRLRVSKEREASRLLYHPAPVYPADARIQGVAVVRFDAVIGMDGTVQSLKVISGHPFLVPAAIEAVREWRYQPALVDGNFVEVSTEIDVDFTLPPK